MADEKTQWSAPKQKHTTLPLTCKVDRLYPPQTGKTTTTISSHQSGLGPAAHKAAEAERKQSRCQRRLAEA